MISSRKPTLNQHGMSNLINIFMFVTLGFVLLFVSFGLYAYSIQSWTGSGTVVDRQNHAASTDTMITPVLITQGIFMVSEVDSPETFSLTIEDEQGNEHPFRVTKEQYDSAPLGSEYTKSE